ncbi:MAG: FecR family protein, partial [Parabacteroides sp.]
YSKEITQRVHRRLAEASEPEIDEVLKEMWNSCNGTTLPQAKRDSLFRKVEAHLHPTADYPETPVSQKRGSWTRIAASYLIPLILVGCAAYFYWQQAETAETEAALIEHFVPLGKREMIVLPDSSRVWLNAGSHLFYPEQFTQTERKVYLSGEGFFEVTKDPQRPFLVQSQVLVVEVLGTRFNLRAYAEDNQIETTLEEGCVQVHLNDTQQACYTLRPDEQLVYIPAEGEATLRKVISAHYSNWRNGGLFFDSAPLSRIFETLTRHYGITIHLQNSSYNNHRLTIHFNQDEQIEHVMRLIKELVPSMNYRIEGSEVFIE